MLKTPVITLKDRFRLEKDHPTLSISQPEKSATGKSGQNWAKSSILLNGHRVKKIAVFYFGLEKGHHTLSIAQPEKSATGKSGQNWAKSFILLNSYRVK